MRLSRPNKQLLGYASIVLYCVGTASSFALVHHLNKQLPVYYNVFATFALTALVAILASWRSLASIGDTVSKNWRQTVFLNMATAGIWIFGFLALNRLPAWVYAITFVGLKPMSTYLYASIFCQSPSTGNGKALNQEKIILGITVALVVFLLQLVVAEYHHITNTDLILGGAFALCALSCGSIYMAVSEQFQQATHLPPMHVLVVRFYLTIIICALIVTWQHNWFIPDMMTMFKLMSLALLTSLVPLFCLQMSIQNLGAVTSAYFFPLILVVAYLLDVSLGFISWNAYHFGLVAILTVLLGYLVWLRYE